MNAQNMKTVKTINSLRQLNIFPFEFRNDANIEPNVFAEYVVEQHNRCKQNHTNIIFGQIGEQLFPRLQLHAYLSHLAMPFRILTRIVKIVRLQRSCLCDANFAFVSNLFFA